MAPDLRASIPPLRQVPRREQGAPLQCMCALSVCSFSALCYDASMIPQIIIESFFLGPLQIHVWGLMVSLGVLLALWIANKEAKNRGLKPRIMTDLTFWVLLGALLGGRIIFVAGRWAYYSQHLEEIWRIWEGGLGVTGGFIGAIITGFIVLKLKRLSFWDYADVGFFALPAGLMIGRLGCFFIFDHPGDETTFLLGETYIDNLVRHNHGLYLSILGALMLGTFMFLRLRNPRRFSGYYIGMFMVLYGIARFSLDFFRSHDLTYADPRFFGLTLAQYVVATGFFIGIAILIKRKQNGRQPTSPLHFAKHLQ